MGAATGVTAWALGSSFYNWGYASYANPYYAETAVAQPIVIEQTVAGGEPQTVSVPAYTYDYSQPIDTQSAPPPEEVASPAVAKFDSARAAFGTGDYAGALKLTDEALKVLPNDATLHEFRALVLFAVGKYDLAAGPLYAVLSVGPGWDWTTMAGLYASIDTYTTQLRKLEAFVSANPTSTAGRFVLAYHYLTQGNTDVAVGQLKEVVALAPQDTLSAQLVKQFSPPAAPSETPAATTAPPSATTPAKPGNLAGNWTAHPASDTTINLRIGDDETFTWKVTAKGKPRQLAGKWSLTNNLLTLAQEGDAGALVGRVSWQADDKWSFRVIGTGAEDQGLLFTH
ncbi:MAG: tetratricopeptide repeat protein [Isosphaeraceae bacterium]